VPSIRGLSRRLGLWRLWRPYPKAVAVQGVNQETINFLRGTQSRDIAEFGIFEGYTSLEFARFLDGRGQLHLFDFQDRVDAVLDKLRRRGFSNVKGFGCSYKLLDSYNWSLAKVLSEHREPLYDYVFLDGAHTWAIDALTFLLVDQLLKPGGYVDFDDYEWSLAESPSMNPRTFPLTARLYSEEQIRTAQVKMIVELLVRRDNRYEEIVPNKIFRKVKP